MLTICRFANILEHLDYIVYIYIGIEGLSGEEPEWFWLQKRQWLTYLPYRRRSRLRPAQTDDGSEVDLRDGDYH